MTDSDDWLYAKTIDAQKDEIKRLRALLGILLAPIYGEVMIWHPVDEMLPPQGKVMLLSDGIFVAAGYLRDLRFYKKPERTGKWMVGHSSSNNVTHWMPMPPPPEKQPL